VDRGGDEICSQKNTFVEKFNARFRNGTGGASDERPVSVLVDLRDYFPERAADQQVAAVISVVIDQALLAKAV